MNVKDEIAAKASEAHRWTLNQAREAMRLALYRRDRLLPDLAELRNLDVQGADGPLAARLYVPKGSPKMGPLMLYFHGGGFVFPGIDVHDALCTRLADAGGIRVLSSSYRLAPEAPFPAQVDDARAVARWVVRNAGKLGADKRKLLVGGDSAGGYLAVATAAQMRSTFKGQVLIYPLMHLEDDMWAKSLSPDTRVIGRLVVRYIEAQLATAGVRAPSLLTDGAMASLPTVLVAGGALDPCAPDAVACASQLKALGAKVEQRTYPALLHGFANLTHTSAASRRAVQEIGELAGALARG